MTENDILNIIYPVLLTVLTAVLTYIGKYAVKVIINLIDLVAAKIGLTEYEKTKAVAFDIWNIIEEHFRINELIGDTVDAKVKMFESLIKQKIPGITDEDILHVRQAIAGEINKDKPIIKKAIDNPSEIEHASKEEVSG